MNSFNSIVQQGFSQFSFVRSNEWDEPHFLHSPNENSKRSCLRHSKRLHRQKHGKWKKKSAIVTVDGWFNENPRTCRSFAEDDDKVHSHGHVKVQHTMSSVICSILIFPRTIAVHQLVESLTISFRDKTNIDLYRRYALHIRAAVRWKLFPSASTENINFSLQIIRTFIRCTMYTAQKTSTAPRIMCHRQCLAE